MPTTKHELLDWLMDVPEDAEIGTDGDGLVLLAILGTDVHLLVVGRIPNADELYSEAVNQAMLERLRRIHAVGGETETGVIIVTFQGYLSGIPIPEPSLRRPVKDLRCAPMNSANSKQFAPPLTAFLATA